MSPRKNFSRQRLGAQIRAERIRVGLSQVELAHRLGIKKQQLSRWELGEFQPSALTLRSIASALGVAVDDLLCMTPTTTAAIEAAKKKVNR